MTATQATSFPGFVTQEQGYTDNNVSLATFGSAAAYPQQFFIDEENHPACFSHPQLTPRHSPPRDSSQNELGSVDSNRLLYPFHDTEFSNTEQPSLWRARAQHHPSSLTPPEASSSRRTKRVYTDDSEDVSSRPKSRRQRTYTLNSASNLVPETVRCRFQSEGKECGQVLAVNNAIAHVDSHVNDQLNELRKTKRIAKADAYLPCQWAGTHTCCHNGKVCGTRGLSRHYHSLHSLKMLCQNCGKGYSLGRPDVLRAHRKKEHGGR
ncbi:hypothetical protein BDP27DRAFT_1317096 [Rhodocollybia butyracea]|uniref:Uncharacterized protein n=1 Tax=Rhodocollybia butyracea TaxID=206335 RepID=A0A9P5Q4B1_9AGAR|nr:hypothetical protein BDP27DRAFT_1317096 [Rhodocollybia butyracea]